MVNSKVQQAVAAAIALGAAAGAHAVDITTVPSANVVYIGGSTAIDPGLQAYYINSTDLVCDGSQGSIDYYSGTASGIKFTAVACVSGAGATTGVSSGTTIAYVKEDNAGSLNGITPLDTSATLAFPALSSLTSTVCPTSAKSAANGLQAYNARACGSGYTSANQYPQLGLSDVEAAIFAADASNLSAFKTLDVVFAPAVSLGLYHALQSLQGLTVGADDVADIPTLTQAQLSSIYTGKISSWTKIVNTSGGTVSGQSVPFGNSGIAGGSPICYDGTQNSTAADCSAPPSVTAHDATIWFCERGKSSGTQQTDQIFFGEIGCAANVSTFPAARATSCQQDGCSWSSSTFLTANPFQGNGTGDLLACLESHDENGQFAIGFASIDNGWGPYQSNTARKDFRYIRVDGVTPSYENVAANRWKLWAQSAGYTPSSTSSPNFATGVAANIVTFMTSSTQGIGSVSSIKALNTAINYTAPAFDGGFLNIPGNGGSTANSSTATLTAFKANPVNSYIKGSPASNNCQPPTVSSVTPDVADYPVWATPVP